jgi:cellulose synthase operon protein C
LTRDAVLRFKGSELEHYFNHVVGGSPGLYLRLNLYANKRFPHNPVFVRNLLSCLSKSRNARSGCVGSFAAPALV